MATKRTTVPDGSDSFSGSWWLCWPHDDLEDGSSRCQTCLPHSNCAGKQLRQEVVVGGRRILAQRAGFWVKSTPPEALGEETRGNSEPGHLLGPAVPNTDSK